MNTFKNFEKETLKLPYNYGLIRFSNKEDLVAIAYDELDKTNISILAIDENDSENVFRRLIKFEFNLIILDLQFIPFSNLIAIFDSKRTIQFIEFPSRNELNDLNDLLPKYKETINLRFIEIITGVAIMEYFNVSFKFSTLGNYIIFRLDSDAILIFEFNLSCPILVGKLLCKYEYHLLIKTYHSKNMFIASYYDCKKHRYLYRAYY